MGIEHNIGDNIKKYRLKKGLSRKKLAELLNVSEVTITRYENNKRQPGIEMINNIAIALDVTINEIIDQGTTNIRFSNSSHHFPDNMIKAINILFTLVEDDYKENNTFSSHTKLMINDQWDLFRLFENIIKFKIDLYSTEDYKKVKDNMDELIHVVNEEIYILKRKLEHKEGD